MNENAKKWVEALRSGDYTQTVDALQDGAGFCCLGVACVIFEQETGKTLRRGPGGFFRAEPETLQDPNFTIVRDWLCLEDGDGSYAGEEGIDSLYLANDRGATFEEIADIIESEPDGLFK